MNLFKMVQGTNKRSFTAVIANAKLWKLLRIAFKMIQFFALFFCGCEMTELKWNSNWHIYMFALFNMSDKRRNEKKRSWNEERNDNDIWCDDEDDERYLFAIFFFRPMHEVLLENVGNLFRCHFWVDVFNCWCGYSWNFCLLIRFIHHSFCAPKAWRPGWPPGTI